MERLVIVVIVAVVAGLVAAVVHRRQPANTPAETGFHVPPQLHRPDFDRPEAEWLVAVFTSATCASCGSMWEKARQLESDAVAVEEIEVTARRQMHDRYGIDGVPTIVVADLEGVVRASFLGPATATDLWAAVAELRAPGSTPAQCDTHTVPPA